MVKSRRISNDLFRIVDFSNFCSNINDMILDQKECEKGCEYEKYAAESKRVLMRNDKCEQDKTEFFLSFCQVYKYFLTFIF